jgi:hypothetical protein
MNRTIILLTLLFVTQIVFSQADFRKGFIITQNGDTTYGLINYREGLSNFRYCLFKESQSQSTIRYTPREIIGYGFINNKYYVSRKIETKDQISELVFLEVIIKGLVSLFVSQNVFYIEKADSGLYKLENETTEAIIEGKRVFAESKRHIGILSWILFDCQEIRKKTQSISLTEKSLTNLIEDYYKCIGSDYIVYKQNLAWTKINFGVSLGFIRSSIKIKTETNQFSYLISRYNSFDPSIGLLLGISSPRISEKIAFQSEFQFFKSSYSSLVTISNPVTTKYHDTYIDLTTISIPLSLKYSFPEKNYSFYTQAGINYDLNIRATTRLLSESVSYNIVNTSEGIPFEINRNQLGYWGGVGLQRSFNRFKISATLRYISMMNLNKTGGITANDSRITLSIIIINK